MKPVVTISSLDADFFLPVRHILREDGFETQLSIGEEETIAAVSEHGAAALLLDGGMDYAVDLSRRLKTDASTARVKIVVLLPADAYRQFGGFLRAGAEECFLRPVEPRRYLAGLRRVLGFVRRPKADAEITAERLEYAGLVVDLKSHRIRHGDREIRVGLVEFGLLRQLMDPPGTVFSREQLIKSAWPDGIFVDPRTVNVHIGRLRRRLRDVMSMEVIRTVRGVGYALEITPQPMS